VDRARQPGRGALPGRAGAGRRRLPGAGRGADFDDAAVAARLYTIAAAPDAQVPITIDRTEVIWAESDAPGLRAHAIAQVAGAEVRFGVDVAVGDPMCVAPRVIAVADVGAVPACAPEMLFGCAHGLCWARPSGWRPHLWAPRRAHRAARQPVSRADH
jgi:hypothetical protein